MIFALASCGMFTKTVKTTPQMPTDRESVGDTSANKPYRSTALDRGEITGEWAVVSVAGHTPESETSPYLLFDPKSGRVYGDNGCNTVNGTYDVNPKDSTLRFSDLITTLRLCPGSDNTETDFNRAMADTRRYSWTFSPELAYLLEFQDAAGKKLMTLQRQDFSFLNGTWRVTAINGTSNDNPDVMLVFDIPELKLHGNTGCNILNGTISIDYGEHNSLSFQQMVTTRMACPEGNVENTLLVALEQVMYARPLSAGSCVLIDGKGESVLTLTRISDASEMLDN